VLFALPHAAHETQTQGVGVGDSAQALVPGRGLDTRAGLG